MTGNFLLMVQVFSLGCIGYQDVINVVVCKRKSTKYLVHEKLKSLCCIACLLAGWLAEGHAEGHVGKVIEAEWCVTGSTRVIVIDSKKWKKLVDANQPQETCRYYKQRNNNWSFLLYVLMISTFF